MHADTGGIAIALLFFIALARLKFAIACTSMYEFLQFLPDCKAIPAYGLMMPVCCPHLVNLV